MIRRLQRADFDQVQELMECFANESGIGDLENPTYDTDHVRQVLLRCEKGGISLVGQKGDQITGVLLSILVPDLWIPEIVRLRELAWYVRPEHRGGTTGARLYSAYIDSAEELRRSGRITSYTMSQLSGSPNFDLERRGFRHLETTFVVGV